MAATLLCVAGVPVLVIVLVWWIFGVPLSSFRPMLNDEVTYWHQALTFSRVGFHGGYYTLGELTNPSGLTPFGPHGPGFVMVYGVFGALLGWHRHSVVVLNLIAIASAAWLWVVLSRASTTRLLLSALLLMTFWPMLFWAPTSMQEGLHDAGAIAIAAFFAHALAPARRRWILGAGWITLAALSFIRPSWAVLIPIWAVVSISPRSAGQWLMALTSAALLALLIVFAYSRTTAPFPMGFLFLKVFDLTSGVRAVADNLMFNIRRTFSIAEYSPLEVLHRFQYWGWLIATSSVVVVQMWYARTGRSALGASSHLVISALVLLAAVIAMLVLYTLTNWAEHRVLSAFLLLGALLPLAAPGRVPLLLPIALIISNIASTGVFLAGFEANRHDNFLWDRRAMYALSDAIGGKVVYDRHASRWCNTLLTAQYPPYLIVVPAGIGLSVVREADQLPLPPRSQYLLLDAPARASLQRDLQLEELAVMPYGTLYRNLEARCP